MRLIYVLYKFKFTTSKTNRLGIYFSLTLFAVSQPYHLFPMGSVVLEVFPRFNMHMRGGR